MPTAASGDFRVAAERRWPAAVAVLAAIAFYVTLPSEFVDGLRYAVGGLALVVLVPLLLFNPRRLNRQSRISRIASVGVALLLLAGNQLAFLQLIVVLVNGSRSDGPSILLASAQVWATNIIAFSVIYWEMDRGGPVARRRDARTEIPDADFRFPQDENGDNVDEVSRKSSEKADWMPAYLDYLYFSATNSMAFSPTDVMPLRPRAKVLMLLEATAGFVMLALVIARSVSLLH